MLKPTTDRLDYGKLLSPPEGYTLGAAVGASYSLDLDALVGACMALGLSADVDSALISSPVYMLETLRRAGDRIALFCQAGQIHMPSNATALYILLEKVVYQIQVKKQGYPPQHPSFHPKFWVLKFDSIKGKDACYRIIVLSRNLTFDRSWDVAMMLEGCKRKNAESRSKPLADMLQFLRGFITGSDDSAKKKNDMLRKLIAEIEYVEFSPDSRDFTDFEFLPVGVPKTAGGKYEMSDTPLFSPASSFHELFIMSPFLSDSVIKEFNQRNKNITNPECLLITRKESLSRLSPEQCSKFSIYTMKDIVVDGETAISEDELIPGKQDIHAKLYMWRRNSSSELYLGSLNATHSALNGNIEFMIRLVSSNKRLNMKKLKEDIFCGECDGADNPFILTKLPEQTENGEDTHNLLEQQIKQLCRMSLKASVEESGDMFRIIVRVDSFSSATGIDISPLLVDRYVPVAPEVAFDGLTYLELSEFFCVTAQKDGIKVRRVIMIPTENIPRESREHAVVNSIIKDSASFYQYISFMLGDDYTKSALEYSDISNSGFFSGRNGIAMPAIYERMLRTAAKSKEKFLELDYVLQMVSFESADLKEFRSLYETFRKAVGLRG